jgi:hypothetical protein
VLGEVVAECSAVTLPVAAAAAAVVNENESDKQVY